MIQKEICRFYISKKLILTILPSKQSLYFFPLFLCFMFSINQMIFAQTAKTPHRIDTIPFQLTAHNNISIKAILNEQDTLNLMLHTAANSMTLIEEKTKELTSIKWSAETAVNSWGGNSSARYSASNALKISDLEWDSIAIWENKNSGPSTDGKFGLNLFEGKVVEFDFDKNILLLHENLPAKAKNYHQLPIEFDSGLMFIKGICKMNGIDYVNHYLLHSGYGGAILLDDEFVAESKIGALIEIIAEKELKDSYGNVLKTKKGILPIFKLGASTFSEVPIGFFEGAIGRQKMSVIGGDLIKRFNMVIDSERRFLYIKANGLKEVAYGK
jgi:hypothetical protein